MRECFLVIALGSLFGLASSFDAGAQNESFGSNGNVWASVGWSYMDLPAVRMLTRVGPIAGGRNPVIETVTDHDGEMDSGWRVDAGARLFGFPMNGSQGTVSVKGFYARFEDTQSARCQNPPVIVGNQACALYPLSDSDPTTQQVVYNNAASTTSITITSRDVDHWGAALELASVASMNGTLWAPRIGVAVKVIDQDIQLNLTDTFANPQTASYNEDLETNYFGLYVGGETSFALGGGFSLGLDGELGIYYARTDYDGTLNANGGLPSNKFTQTLSLDDDEVAVIASLKAELKNTIGMADFSLFAMADYYSYAPEMKYKQQDFLAGVATTSGGNPRTSIGEDDAWSATLGGKVTLRLN